MTSSAGKWESGCTAVVPARSRRGGVAPAADENGAQTLWRNKKPGAPRGTIRADAGPVSYNQPERPNRTPAYTGRSG